MVYHSWLPHEEQVEELPELEPDPGWGRMSKAELMDSTPDSRVWSAIRFRRMGIWNDAYYRKCKQYHGSHARGPKQNVQYIVGGHVYRYAPRQGSFDCWKNTRRYQCHNRQ